MRDVEGKEARLVYRQGVRGKFGYFTINFALNLKLLKHNVYF